MTAITVTNTEWTILNAIDTALTGATISAATVFKSVTVTTSDEQARQAQMTADTGNYPLAIIRFVNTTQYDSPESYRGCLLEVELILATRVGPAKDQAAHVQEALRLTNAAKNAVEAGTITGAHSWGDENDWHEKFEWGQPELDTDETTWTVAKLPLIVSFSIASPTSH